MWSKREYAEEREMVRRTESNIEYFKDSLIGKVNMLRCFETRTGDRWQGGWDRRMSTLMKRDVIDLAE